MSGSNGDDRLIDDSAMADAVVVGVALAMSEELTRVPVDVADVVGVLVGVDVDVEIVAELSPFAFTRNT
jgi:hypothetical protein